MTTDHSRIRSITNPLICSKDELVLRLEQFPAEQTFESAGSRPDHSFIHWCNSHCFLWTRESDHTPWSVEEL